MNIKTINVQKIFAESKPAKAASEHLKEVQKVLTAGLDKVVEQHKDDIASPQAQSAIAEARNMLNGRMQQEANVANDVVIKLLVEATDEWRKQHDDVEMIISRQNVIFAADKFDITGEILDIFNAMKPEFPDLPIVNVKDSND